MKTQKSSHTLMFLFKHKNVLIYFLRLIILIIIIINNNDTEWYNTINRIIVMKIEYYLIT